MATIGGVPNQPPLTGLAEKIHDPRAITIPCPVLRTLANEDLVHVSPDGNVDTKELKQAFAKIGVSDLMRNLLVVGGAGTQAGGFMGGLAAAHLNLFDLINGPLVHNADSQILRHGFNQENLDKLLAFSSDGKSLTVSDLAAAQSKWLAADPGSRGHNFGMVELSALITVFGHPNEEGEKSLSKDDLTRLFRDNKLPEGFTPHRVGLVGLTAEVARFAHAQKSTPSGRAQAGLNKATGQPEPLDATSLSAMRKAMCPAYRPDSQASALVTPSEVAAAHQAAGVKTPVG